MTQTEPTFHVKVKLQFNLFPLTVPNLEEFVFYYMKYIDLFKNVAHKVFDERILMFLHFESVQSTVSRT